MRVTPENAITLARAIRALTTEELQKIDVLKVLRALLTAHDEGPERTLFHQLRLTASFVDECLFGSNVM